MNASFTAPRRTLVAAIGAVAPLPLPSCLTLCTAHQGLYTHSGCIDPTPDNSSWHAYMLLSLSETSVPISLVGHHARHQPPRCRAVVPCIWQRFAILPLHPKACPAQVDLADRAASVMSWLHGHSLQDRCERVIHSAAHDRESETHANVGTQSLTAVCGGRISLRDLCRMDSP